MELNQGMRYTILDNYYRIFDLFLNNQNVMLSAI